MRICCWFSILLAAHGLLNAQGFKKLPDWAIPTYLTTRNHPKPAETDAWVLLDRTEFAYTGDGTVAIHQFRLIEVLSHQGTSAGIFIATGLGGNASKIRKLKGWNLRPDGEMIKLDREQVVAIEKPGDGNGVSNIRLTGASLDRVVKDSVVAFESIQEVTNPSGPALISGVMDQYPIFRWEVSAATQGGWFRNLKDVSFRLEYRHFSPWIETPKLVPNVSISAGRVPPIPRGESASPHAWNILPRVMLTFTDPDLKSVPSFQSWDGLALWIESVFAERASANPLPEQPTRGGVEGLSSIHTWMNQHLNYKQVYLSPERGWMPLPAAQVIRSRYGDCKDLTSCFLAAARAAGFEAYPVLARIEHEPIEADEPVNPACFNHVIAAVRSIPDTHLGSEVTTSEGRFILVDPTARFTPMGLLPSTHFQGRLMICAKGKGLWVDVPEAALEKPRLEIVFKGDGQTTGQILGILSLREWGNARGLRSAALGLPPTEFQQFVFSSVLSLPSSARLDVIQHSNPLLTRGPFEVSLRLNHPQGFDIHESEWALNPMGIFRMVPSIIQQAGQLRHFPIETFGFESVDVEAHITVPARLAPILSRSAGSSPFHEFQWEAQAHPSEGLGTTLSLSFRNTEKPARFGFETMEKGLAEWSKDRRTMQDVLTDALAFKVQP